MVASRTETYQYLKQVLPTANGDFASISMPAYLNNIKLSKLDAVDKTKPLVALVVASGNILDGNQPEGTVGGDSIANIFEGINEDDRVKAVVLRVDSPGGSAFASDVIRDAIAETRNNDIPVVVSMGSYAASGGYWIATEADRVLAMSTTITGSIGVFGLIPTFEDSLKALGIHSDGVGTSPISGMMQLDQPMTPQAKMIIQSGVENVYTRFLTLVAEARDTTPGEVHKIAQGRVWTGEKAVQLGLVDELGDLNQAIKKAANIAGISNYRVDYRRKELSFVEQIMMEINGNISAAIRAMGIDSWLPQSLHRQVNHVLKALEILDTLTDPNGIYLYCDNCPQ